MHTDCPRSYLRRHSLLGLRLHVLRARHGTAFCASSMAVLKGSSFRSLAFHSIHLHLSVCIRVNLWLKFFARLVLWDLHARRSASRPNSRLTTSFRRDLPWLASFDSPLNSSVKIRAFRGQKELRSACSSLSFLVFRFILSEFICVHPCESVAQTLHDSALIRANPWPLPPITNASAKTRPSRRYRPVVRLRRGLAESLRRPIGSFAWHRSHR